MHVVETLEKMAVGGASFNSLFEMLLDVSRHEGGAVIPAFNSLFEMHFGVPPRAESAN